MSIGLTAYADSSSGYTKNPFYTGEKSASLFQPLMATAYSNEPDYYTFKGNKYYTQNDMLYKIIRDALASRKTSVNIRLYSDRKIYRNQYQTVVSDLFENATEDRLSVSSTDGDYARWSVSSFGWEFSYDNDSNGYYYDARISFAYYSTAKQEQQADTIINEIVSDVRRLNLSDYETVKYIHDLICDLTTYDYEAAEDATSKYDYAFTAYGALCKGLSVCQGYSSAFYRICRELGFNVRFVSSDPRIGCHAWNLIQLDDKFYFVDATWDDEIRDDEELAVGFDNDLYYFFLVDYDSLRTLDNHGEHTLYNALYNNDYYNQKYRDNTSKEPYDFETATGLSTCTISLSSTSLLYNGKAQKPEIVVTDKNGNIVKDYTAKYSNYTNCGRAKISVVGKNDYIDSVSYRTYNILPSKMTNLGYVADSRTSTSLSLKWSKYSGGADGYEIQQYKNGAWKTVKAVGNVTSAKIIDLTPNSTVKFRICAYKKINNSKQYGEFSNVYTTVTKPSNVKAPSLSTKTKTISIKWTKVNCSGYEIQIADNSSMKNATTYNVSYKDSQKKLTNRKKGKKYYVRIRAYKQYNGLKYRSAWSSKKSITVK